MAESRNLDALFYPSSIAVIGASRHRGTIGAEIFHNILMNGYQGVIFPVNPNAKFIQAVRCYSTIQDIPDEVDLAIIVVPKQIVLSAIEGCVQKKVKAIVIISAGFKEVGSKGAQLEQQVLEVCRKNNISLVGPNCLGILNTDPAAQLDATFAPTYPPEGNVAFSSQSGALGHAILEYAKELGIGISKFVSVGNKADVSGNDLIQYWEHDPKTKVILLYLESFGNPKKFLEVARRVGKSKPIVAVKSGRSESGARAAASHTGSLATSEILVQALFHQTGVIRTDSMGELFDVAMLLSNQPLPKGRRLAILTNAGGPGILAADACESLGILLSEFSEHTLKELRKLVHSEASIRNPIDLTAHGTPDIYNKAVSLLLAEDAVDALLIIYVPPLVTHPKEIADAIVEAASGTQKTILTCFMGKRGVPEGLHSLKRGNIPSYPFPEEAVHAIGHVMDHVDWKNEPSGKIVSFADFDESIIKKISSHKGWLDPEQAFLLLKAIGLPVVPWKIVKCPEEAAKASSQLGYPVVLKIDSTKILHKTDFGGVVVGLEDSKSVQSAGEQMIENAIQYGIEKKDIKGFVLQKMASKGEDIIVGANRDESFGVLFMFGLGGVEVELHKDLAFRLHPLRDIDVHQMIREIRGIRLLQGFRNRPSYDLECIENILLRLSVLVEKMPNIQEFDLNPIRVFQKGAVVLDARIRLE